MRKQSGQSMIEYVVILGALSAALLAPGLGSVGETVTDQNSFLEAISDKHRGHGYTVSLSDLPESDDLLVLVDYYDRLGKYPALSSQLKSGSNKLASFSNNLTQLSNTIGQVQQAQQYFPPSLPTMSSLPSFP